MNDAVLVALDRAGGRNRNLALRVLQAWNVGASPVGAREVVVEGAATDPNEKLRAYAAEVLEPAAERDLLVRRAPGPPVERCVYYR